jgi:hypothetical protein
VSSDTTSGGQLPGAGTRVDGDGLLDDQAIGDELANGLTGVGVGDFVDFVGIEPDLALSAVGDRGREALLGAEVDPARGSGLACSAGHSRSRGGGRRGEMGVVSVGAWGGRNRI